MFRVVRRDEHDSDSFAVAQFEYRLEAFKGLIIRASLAKDEVAVIVGELNWTASDGFGIEGDTCIIDHEFSGDAGLRKEGIYRRRFCAEDGEGLGGGEAEVQAREVHVEGPDEVGIRGQRD